MPNKLAIVLVIFTTFFWGANFNAGKIIVESYPPLAAAAVRFAIASLIVLPFLLFSEKGLYKLIKKHWVIYIILGLVGVTGTNCLLFLGLKYTSPINSALIMATNPLVTLLLSFFILKEVITLRQGAGMLLSLLGVIFVITQGSLAVLFSLDNVKGDLIMMGSNLCWALYSVLGLRYLKGRPPLVTTAMTMIVGTVFLIALASLSGASEAPLAGLPWQVYAALVYMAVFGSVLAYLFWNYGVAKLGAAHTSVFFNLVPVFTVLISLVFGQAVSVIQLMGGALVILGVAISIKKRPRVTPSLLN